MKKIYVISSTIFLLFLIQFAFANPSNRIRIAGGDYFIFGANLAWLQGQYDHDFGENHQHPGWGVWYSSAANRTSTDGYLSDLTTMGCHVIRVWLWEGLEGLLFSGESTLAIVTGVHPGMWNNLDYFMSRVSTRNLYVYWCLANAFGPYWGPESGLHFAIVTSSTVRQSYINNAVIPFITRYKGHPNIFAIDLMNEPEADVAGPRGNWTLSNGTNWATMTTFLRACRDAIKATDSTRLVSCGSGWHDYQNIRDGYYNLIGLDFYDYHDYRDDGSMPNYYSTLSTALGGKPCILGEYGQGYSNWSDDTQNNADTNFMNNAWNNGFAGSLVWQYNYPGATEVHTLVNSNTSWRPVGTTMRNFSASRHIGVNLGGDQTRIISTTGSYLFFIGTGLDTTSVTFSVVSVIGVDTVTIAANDERHQNATSQYYLSRWFRIISNGNVKSANITFTYTDKDFADANFGTLSEASIQIARYASGSWSWFPATARDTGANWVRLDGVTSFSDWTLSAPGGVPVELSAFYAIIEPEEIDLPKPNK
ncbi:MAG: cellulase family glycosylhydrolase [bacterium]|nr:cellulase family glycosylhydrolase [bacterium]